MNSLKNRGRIYLYGLATGIVIALIWFAIHTFINMWPKPVLITADNYNDYRHFVWVMALSQRSIPPVEIPASAKDIMFYDGSGIDKYVFISFRATSDDVIAYEYAITKDRGLKKIERGQPPDSEYEAPCRPPSQLGDILDKYWIPYEQMDYYYGAYGFYLGVAETNSRVFINIWTK